MQSQEGRKIARTLQRSLHRLVVATAVLYLAIFALGFYVYNVARNNSEGLCTYRNDLAERNRGTRAYIRKHPNGTKAIPRSLLEVSLANGVRTEKSLAHIHCPPPPPSEKPKPQERPKAPLPRGSR